MMNIKPEELEAIVAAVNVEVDALLKSQSEELKKASPGEGAPAELKDETDKNPGMEGAGEAEAPTDMGAVEPEAPADPEELKAAYAALAPDELKLHYLACKAALMEMMGHDDDVMNKKESSESKSDEKSEPVSKKEMSSSKEASESSKEAKKMELEEVAPNKKFGEPKEDRVEEVAVTKLGKSEKEEAFEKELVQLKKSYEALYQAVDTLITIPSRKAVTNSDAIQPKVDVKAFTTDQVTEKLKAITSDPEKLQKSDVDLINQYYAKQIGVEKIEHLLK